MLKNRYLLLTSFVFTILTINFISASGLQVIGTNSFDINKTTTLNKQITIQIKNEESYTFYNISFEDNPYITMNKIESLPSGSLINVTANVISQIPFDNKIKIIGYYYSNLGQAFDTYYLNVDYENGVDDCLLTIIKGDTISWKNNVNDEIKIINADNGNEVSTIPKNSSYQTTFESPSIFNYFFTRRGFQFTEQCTITSLDTQGLVNNPEYNSFIDLKVNIEYEPTTIQTTFLQKDYSMNFYDTDEGIFTIKNTGTKIAKNVKLSGDWFSFSANIFDINPGATKSISYVISPAIYQTNQTNQTYVKNIEINGNFETKTEPFSVYINYANIGDNYNSTLEIDDEIIKYLIKAYCAENPEEDFCKKEIIYKNFNQSDMEFNVTYQKKQVDELWNFFFSESDTNSEFRDYVKEKLDLVEKSANETLTQANQTSLNVNSLKSEQENSNNFIVFVLGTILFLGICGLFTYLILDQRKKNKSEVVRRW